MLGTQATHLERLQRLYRAAGLLAPGAEPRPIRDIIDFLAHLPGGQEVHVKGLRFLQVGGDWTKVCGLSG